MKDFCTTVFFGIALSAAIIPSSQRLCVVSFAAEDQKEEVSDPSKYLNMYRYMVAATTRAKEKNVPMQIIVVDNDIPPQIQMHFPNAVVAHYKNEGTDGLTLGLIDDAYLLDQ